MVQSGSTLKAARPSRAERHCGSAVNMMQTVHVGWGRSPRTVTIPSGSTIVHPRRANVEADGGSNLLESLMNPVGSKPLQNLLKGVKSVCVLVPDNTRKNVSDLVLPLLSEMLDGLSWQVGIATGKHPVYEAPPRIDWVHDARSPALQHVGRTARGTEVFFPPSVIDADLRILIGEIRPHYFAGYGGGAKTLFPGVAGGHGIWSNHELKALPGARIGSVRDNPCRMDMEEAAALAGPSFIINLVRAPSGTPVGYVSGDPVEAHRAGVQMARRLFEIPIERRSDVVIVSDRSPVTMNLYQACKLLPPAGTILSEGGTIILMAECGEGLGPVDTINRKIYELGVIHSLPRRHRVVLVSARSRSEVQPTFADYAQSVDHALRAIKPRHVAVLPYGGEVIPTLASQR